MQRRVQKADTDGLAAHDVEERYKIRLLHRQEAFEHRGAVLGGVGEDHLAHDRETLFVEEHVLCPAKPDPFCSEGERRARLCRRIGIGTHAYVPRRIGPAQKGLERAVDRGFEKRRLIRKRLAPGAV